MREGALRAQRLGKARNERVRVAAALTAAGRPVPRFAKGRSAARGALCRDGPLRPAFSRSWSPVEQTPPNRAAQKAAA